MKLINNHLIIILMLILSVTELPQSNYFMVDRSPVFVPEPGYQGTPSVTFNGTNYFAVWGDNRAAVASVMIGTFIDQDGNVLNPAGNLLLTSEGNKNEPVAAFDGNNFLIVWRDDRNGEDDIYGARFTADGILIENEFPVSTAPGDEWGEEIVFDGTNFFVVWIDLRNGNEDIYGARIDQSGNVLDPSGIAICTEAHDQEYPRISSGTNHYMVVWEDLRNDSYGDYYGARIDFTGTVLNPDGFVIQDGSDDQIWGDVCFDGTNWLVVWCQYPDVRGKRISASGNILDPSALLLTPSSGNAIYCRLKFDGTNFLLTWETYEDDIKAARISTSGNLIDPNGIDISVNNLADEEFPSIVYGNGKFFISWMDERNGGIGSDIYGARINTGGSLLDNNGILLSASANKQTYPGCAFDGENYLVVWEDNRDSDTTKIYAARINQAGALISPGAIRLSGTPGIQSFPSVCFDGINFIIVWYDERTERDIYGARVSTQGNILDQGGFKICDASNLQYIPAITSNGSQSLVVWTDYRNSPTEIWGARIDQSGNVLDLNGFQIYSGNNSGAGLDVTYGYNSYLVTYGRQGSGSNPWDIYGSRVSTDGTILDPGGFIISNATNNQDWPAAAYDGTNFFVVWQDNRNNQSEDDIFGTRVSTDGTVLEPSGILITSEPDYQQAPEVIFDRNQYIVAWFDKGDELNLKGVDLDLSGNITDAYTVSDQFGLQTYPSLAHGPEDQVLIIYQGFATEYQNTNYNALRTWGTFLGLYVDVEKENSNVPDDFLLYQNYPNPFNPNTVISYQSQVGSMVTLIVYDVLGNQITTLVNEYKPAGIYNVQFTMNNLSSGVYFYQLKAGNYIYTKKMILIK